MKTQLRSLFFASLFLALALLFVPVGEAGPPGPFCALKVLDDLAKKHAQLHKWVYDGVEAATSRITSGKRWKDSDLPLGQAHTEINASLARAHDVSTNGGTGGVELGEETIKAQATAFTSEKVADSTKTSLEVAGEGIGLAARQRFNGLNGDADLAKVITDNTEMFKAPGSIFDGKDYDNPEFFRDYKTVFDGDSPPPTYGGFKAELDNAQLSSRQEIRTAAHYKVKHGHKIEVAAGADLGPAPAKKADVLTDKAYIQVGERGKTLEGKFENNGGPLAEAIKEARDQNRAFIFAHSEEGFVPNLEKTRNINLGLAQQYGITLSNEVLDGPTQGIIDVLGDKAFPSATAYISYVPIE